MRKMDFPNRITVEVTNDCNVSCVFCNRQKICMDLGYMEVDLFHKIIDEAAEHLPIKLVPFFRGEPLMHPQIIDLLSYAKEKGIGPIQLATNALLLDDDMQCGLIEAGVDFISFSLDTRDRELYSSSRKFGDLKTSEENVLSFSEKCKNRKRQGFFAPVIQVSTINLPEYIPGQPEFVEFWKKHVDVVRVYEEHDERGKLVDPVLREKLDVLHDRKPCRKVFTDMLIYWDGRLALCNYDWDEFRALGNINNLTLLEAWNSEEYENVRKMHIENIYDEGICKECHHWKIDYMENGYLGKSYYHEKEEKR